MLKAVVRFQNQGKSNKDQKKKKNKKKQCQELEQEK